LRFRLKLSRVPSNVLCGSGTVEVQRYTFTYLPFPSLGGYVDVLKYTLRFSVLNRYVRYAEATITGVARWSIDSLTLDFHGYTVDSVNVGSTPTTFRTVPGTLTVYLPSPLNPGDTLNLTVFTGIRIRSPVPPSPEGYTRGATAVSTPSATHRGSGVGSRPLTGPTRRRMTVWSST